MVCTIVICPNCGKNTPEGKFCEFCGASVQTTQTFQQPVAQQPVYTQQPVQVKTEKSAGIAAILAFFFPGSGQVYNGEIGKGIGIFIGYLIGLCIFLIPGIIVLIYGIYDAYKTSQKMNKGEIPYKESSTAKLIVFIIAELVLFFVFWMLVIAAFVFGSSGARYY